MAREEWFSRIEKAIDDVCEVQSQQTIAIRNLIVLAAAILDAQKQLSDRLHELQDAQKHTDERLNALIDTVDRVIRGGSSDPNA
jgi:hypothetical protein